MVRHDGDHPEKPVNQCRRGGGPQRRAGLHTHERSIPLPNVRCTVAYLHCGIRIPPRLDSAPNLHLRRTNGAPWEAVESAQQWTWFQHHCPDHVYALPRGGICNYAKLGRRPANVAGTTMAAEEPKRTEAGKCRHRQSSGHGKRVDDRIQPTRSRRRTPTFRLPHREDTLTIDWYLHVTAQIGYNSNNSS